jgi:hypothetical protein
VPDLREAVAHAATPWKWRSRWTVIVLIIATVVFTVAMILDGWLGEGNNPVLATIVWGGLGSLLLVRPAIRSLRRWDDAHRSEEDRPIPTERA